MRPIILGAGRGSRLKAMTADQPKPYVRIDGRRILNWVLDSLLAAGLQRPVFVGGYQIDLIRSDYSYLDYCHNERWESTNMLASLFCAEEHMEGGFVCTYADILYRPSVVRQALEHPADIVLCVDVDWRSRYADRSQHPEDDAEKVQAEGDQVRAINRSMPSDQAIGEYIGVARFSAAGAQWLRQHYHRLRESFDGVAWRDGRTFEHAYLIHLFQDMIEEGVAFHMVTTEGGYMEVDTEEDYALANQIWPQSWE